MVSGVFSSCPSFITTLPVHWNRLDPLRHWFPQNHDASSHKLKNRQVAPVSLSHLSQLTQESLEAKWDQVLKEVHQALLALSGEELDLEAKGALKSIFDHLTLNKLKLFLNALPDWQRETDVPLSDLALEAISPNKMEEIIKKMHPEHFTTLDAFVKHLASCLPQPVPLHQEPDNGNTTDRSQNVVTAFLSNFGRIFMQSFNIFDNPRPPDTIYEYHVLTAIYFQFFKIPYVLVFVLAQFIVSPWNVLITTLVLAGIAIASLYTYMRWLKPCPHKVWYCETLDNLKIPAVFCHEQELQQALDFLGNGKHSSSRSVVFVGEPGVGKTELMKAVAASLNKKRVFMIDPSKLFGSSQTMMSVMEKMTISFKEVRGFENEVVFLLDEAGDAFKSKTTDMLPLFKMLKDYFPDIKIIAAMTKDQWKQLIEYDRAIKDRFKIIETQELNAEQTLRVLEFEASRKYPCLPIAREGFQAIVDETTKRKKGCQPRQALFALEDLAKCADSMNQKISQAEHKLANMKAEIERPDCPLNQPFSKEYHSHLEAIGKQELLITDLKDIQNKGDQLEQQIRRGLAVNQKYIEQRNEAVRSLSSHASLTPEEKAMWQKRLMFTNFFAFQQMKRWLDESRKSFADGTFPLIDKKYVEQKLAT